jgi:hypothetical protein
MAYKVEMADQHLPSTLVVAVVLDTMLVAVVLLVAMQLVVVVVAEHIAPEPSFGTLEIAQEMVG